MFDLPPAYDDAVNFVIETLSDMGIACNNAPETHHLPLCNDGLHFHNDAEPHLIDMWEKAVTLKASHSTSSPLMLNCSADEGAARRIP